LLDDAGERLSSAAFDEPPGPELVEVGQALVEDQRTDQVRGEDRGKVVARTVETALDRRIHGPLWSGEREPAQRLRKRGDAIVEEPRVERQAALQPRVGDRQMGGERFETLEIIVGAGPGGVVDVVEPRPPG